jgi:hypothetical protein
MSQEDIFARIKSKCDEKRVMANGTGRPLVFTITKDGVHHSMSIGAKVHFGCEFIFVGSHEKQTAEALLVGIIEAFIESRSNSVPLPNRFVVSSDPWGLEDANYDKVNLSLSGTLAAVYGTYTPLKQLLVSDAYKKLPRDPGYKDSGIDQTLYL